jgi:hypothetical protein
LPQSCIYSSSMTTPHSWSTTPYIISLSHFFRRAAYSPLAPSPMGMLISSSRKLIAETGVMKYSKVVSTHQRNCGSGRPTAVPDKKASTILPSFHASSISSIVKFLSTTSKSWIPGFRYFDPATSRCLASSSTLPLVTPSKITFASKGAVTSCKFPSFVFHTMKKLLAPASVT